MEVSYNGGTPKSFIFNEIFHKPTILAPQFWKPPYQCPIRVHPQEE